MKKATPYIILALIVTAAMLLLFTGDLEREKVFDPRVTLRSRDKIPYGSYVAYQHLRQLFPGVLISREKNEPANWDSLSYAASGQALLIVSPGFFADENQVKRLIRFAGNGNDVFISAMELSDHLKSLLECSTSYFDFSDLGAGSETVTDTLRISLKSPPFPSDAPYSYPGYRFDSHFIHINASTTDVLGYDHAGRINFIHLRTGSGNLYVHLAPLAFSNYFLLSRDNLGYFERVLSVISPGVKKLVWDEYFIDRRYSDNPQNGPGWFKALMGYPGLKWALLTAIGVLLLYVLLEMRRKQRYIPVMVKPRNDSLDFVKTIGRLYYDKGDHRNLARKMGSYFLEHVRSRYKLPTGSLDEEFVRKLQFKTGYAEEELREIVSFIAGLEQSRVISDKQLAGFYKQLELFYQKT